MYRSPVYPYKPLDSLTPRQVADSMADQGGNLPTSATLIYYAKIPALSDANPTNWLLTRYPDAYLYACLLEAMPYNEEDARMQTWATAYATAIDKIQRDDKGARYTQGTIRVMQATP